MCGRGDGETVRKKDIEFQPSWGGQHSGLVNRESCTDGRSLISVHCLGRRIQFCILQHMKWSSFDFGVSLKKTPRVETSGRKKNQKNCVSRHSQSRFPKINSTQLEEILILL